jgi:hypothetical protein
MAHACNPSYLRGKDQEDHVLVLAWGKTLARFHFINKPGVVAVPVILAMWEA